MVQGLHGLKQKPVQTFEACLFGVCPVHPSPSSTVMKDMLNIARITWLSLLIWGGLGLMRLPSYILEGSYFGGVAHPMDAQSGCLIGLRRFLSANSEVAALCKNMRLPAVQISIPHITVAVFPAILATQPPKAWLKGVHVILKLRIQKQTIWDQTIRYVFLLLSRI